MEHDDYRIWVEMAWSAQIAVNISCSLQPLSCAALGNYTILSHLRKVQETEDVAVVNGVNLDELLLYVGTRDTRYNTFTFSRRLLVKGSLADDGCLLPLEKGMRRRHRHCPRRRYPYCEGEDE